MPTRQCRLDPETGWRSLKGRGADVLIAAGRPGRQPGRAGDAARGGGGERPAGDRGGRQPRSAFGPRRRRSGTPEEGARIITSSAPASSTSATPTVVGLPGAFERRQLHAEGLHLRAAGDRRGRGRPRPLPRPTLLVAAVPPGAGREGAGRQRGAERGRSPAHAAAAESPVRDPLDRSDRAGAPSTAVERRCRQDRLAAALSEPRRR